MLNSEVFVSAPVRSPVSPDHLRAAVARERARANAAEARVIELEKALGEAETLAEQLRRETIEQRSSLNGLRLIHESNRKKLAVARTDLKELGQRQSARNVRKLEREVVRLKAILRSSEIDPGAESTTGRRKEIFRLKDVIAQQAEELEELRAAIEKLRATRATHAKARFGSSSEKTGKAKPGSGRKRGQQAGKSGHGRTERPQTECRTETHNPPEADRICPCCAKPYVQNGSHDCEIVEIEVKAHVRKVRRPRWRQTCDCAAAPKEVAAPPVPRLFPNTAYGISFWVCFLFECYACHRPLNRVAAWMGDRGLPVSAGTLAGCIPRLMLLFASLSQAILDHMKGSGTLHGDETGWRVQCLNDIRGTARAWLWCACSRDAVWFRVDARRNAEAARKLFAGIAPGTVLVCDAYAAYKKLVRVLGDNLILSWCRVHVRRKFIQAAAGNEALKKWEERWLGRFARLFHLNRVRLKHYTPEGGLDEQPWKFRTAQRQLQSALNRLFALAEKELAGPAGSDRRAKALRSLVNHREGLSVFIDRPGTPMDNNFAERVLRGPVIGRKLSYGSDSLEGARFSAMMYGVFETLRLNRIDVGRWLTAWLTACAQNGGRPPDDLAPWLPWSMDEKRRQAFANPP